MNAFQPAAAFPADVIADVAVPEIEQLPGDLDRVVYCILGMPVDAVTMTEAAARLRSAVRGTASYLVSTPNLNFLINSLENPAFRGSLLKSDLCTADGMPVVWIARLLGIPLKERVAGSSLYDALVNGANAAAVPTFLFGGPEGAAEAACARLDRAHGGLQCAGHLYPGFGDVDALSTPEIIDAINGSSAKFLVVSLGALKGQLWLLRNHDALRPPVRVHLGAAINFAAGTVARAPRTFQRLGLEWAWRIKEEPHLWRRYWNDGLTLLRLMATRVLPLALARLGDRFSRKGRVAALRIDTSQTPDETRIALHGPAISANAGEAAGAFKTALLPGPRAITVDLATVTAIDARFLGLLMMLTKMTSDRGIRLAIVSPAATVKRTILRHEAGYLLTGAQEGEANRAR